MQAQIKEIRRCSCISVEVSGSFSFSTFLEALVDRNGVQGLKTHSGAMEHRGQHSTWFPDTRTPLESP
ncbi:hypothetical protein AGIG_G4932 [Arapaima gigas]